MRPIPVLVLFAIVAACDSGDDTGEDALGYACGPGTHAESGVCVADADTADTGTDTDSADTSNDSGDTGTDSAGDSAETGDTGSDTSDTSDSGADTATDTASDTASDCGGDPADCRWSGENDLSSPYYELRGNRASEVAGYDVAVGDVNGDGQDDVVVGAPYGDDGAADAGVVYVVHGPITADMSLSSADAILVGTDTNGIAGFSVAVVDDTDGDGADEVVVGQRYPANISPGAVYLFLGGSAGSRDLEAGDGVWSGEANGDQLGAEVASVGDVNGDGNGDFAAGAPQNTTRSSNGGAVYVFFGGASGTGSASAADSRIYGSTAVHAGTTVSGAGDTDGDGIDDLLVGTDGNVGQVALFLGPPDATTYFSSSDAMIKAENASDYLAGDNNQLSAAGDVNGDGLGDVWLGAYGYDGVASNAGKAYLLHGPLTGSLDLFVDSDASISGTTASALLGMGLTEVGDLDGDGFADGVVGAVGANRYGTYTGAAWLFYGPISGNADDSDADVSFVGNGAGDFAGTGTAVGEVTGDGLMDLVVGAYAEDGDSTGSGSAWVIPGVGL